MNRRQTNGDMKGAVHLWGMDAHDHETFCGFQWSENRYEDTSDSVTCRLCLNAMKEAAKLLAEAQGREYAYEILAVNCTVPETLLEVRVIETGEQLEVPYDQVLLDPEEQ